MKALAAEIVRKLGKRLQWLGISVRELTGASWRFERWWEELMIGRRYAAYEGGDCGHADHRHDSGEVGRGHSQAHGRGRASVGGSFYLALLRHSSDHMLLRIAPEVVDHR